MTTFAEQNYENLNKLVEKSEAFHFKDFTLNESIYRIFNYRLASWSLFLEPGALNCRGIMFDITNPEKIKLVSLPPEKFFNYEEGGVDHTKGKFGDKMEKMDGSLISTYVHNDELFLKSKASLFSSQAVDSMKFLNAAENAQFKEELTRLAKDDYTINLEYTSPENRIVVSYQNEALTVLSVRSHITGENFFASKLEKLLEDKGGMPEIKKHLVSYENLRNKELVHQKFVDGIRDEQNGEGYVVEVVLDEKESYLVKVKNLKYIALHQTKDSVNSSKRLFEAIINEASDDLRSMFADDKYVLDLIAEMENKVQPIYNRIITIVETFNKENNHLPRKDFAIKAIEEYPQFKGLIINNYVNDKIRSGELVQRPNKEGKVAELKENDYKEFAIRNRKEVYGIGEEEMELDENGNIVKKKASTLVI